MRGGAPRSEGHGAAGLEQVRERYARLVEEVHRVIIGQEGVVQNLVSALFARGHCLLIGVRLLGHREVVGGESSGRGQCELEIDE